jgi:hypothetical protein
MHGNNRTRLGRNRLFDQIRLQVERAWVNVNEDGGCAETPNCTGRGEERETGHYHFVTGANF